MPAPLETSFVIPTLQELIATISGDIQSQLPGSDPYIENSDEWVFARVLAGAEYLQFGFLRSILRELFVGSALETNLPRIGSIWGVLRNEPTNSKYTIEVEATDAATVPAATLLTSSNGIEFLTDTELVFVGAGTDTVDITSVDTGTDNNLSVGAVVTFTIPLADIEATATVTAVVEDAADIEAIEDYRARILDRIQHHPQGGAVADYTLWTMDVDGVTRCWVDSPTLGEVRVVFDGTPAAVTVQSALDEVKPVTAVVTAIKGTGYELFLDLSVKKVTGYSSADVLDNIVNALDALCISDGGPQLTIYNSEIRQAISNAVGVDYYTINHIIVDGVDTGSLNSNVTAPASKFHALDETNQRANVAWL